MNKNIKLSQEPILYIDATPNDDYPIRILRAYRENCNATWTDNTTGKEPTRSFAYSNE